MTADAMVQGGLFLAALALAVMPLGLLMARVFEGRVPWGLRFLGPIERLTYRAAGIDPDREMTWRQYARAVLAFSLLGVLSVYAFQRLQGFLPLNPEGLPAVSPDSAFNTAVSFASNTNWQGYAGESTMGYLVQSAALTVQNFVSAASGMAVLAALIRGFTRRRSETIGNFWADMTRSVVYILLPLSVVLALVLVSQGVVQTTSPYREAPLLEPTVDADGKVSKTSKVAKRRGSGDFMSRLEDRWDRRRDEGL